MTNFSRAHDRYLDPPDDDPICEDGCGEAMTRDITGEWYCANKFCPSKFEGVEKEMAEMLIGANETVKHLAEKVRRLSLGLKS